MKSLLLFSLLLSTINSLSQKISPDSLTKRVTSAKKSNSHGTAVGSKDSVTFIDFYWDNGTWTNEPTNETLNNREKEIANEVRLADEDKLARDKELAAWYLSNPSSQKGNKNKKVTSVIPIKEEGTRNYFSDARRRCYYLNEIGERKYVGKNFCLPKATLNH